MSSDRTRKLLTAALSILLLLACQIPSLGAPVAPPTATQVQPPTLTALPTDTQAPTETPAPSATPTPAARARRVVILSIDGLRPDAIALAPMQNLLVLMQNGAYSLSAQTTYPSVTLSAHASMLTGMCPSKHGVNWNDYMPENGYAQGTDLFDVAHAAGLRTYMYVTKKKLGQLTEPSSLDKFVFVNDRDTVLMKRLLEEFPEDFGLLFIHFGITDGMGHSYGWLSPQQFSVLFRADQALGQLLDELDARGLRSETLIIVTADHGGHASTHGSDSPEDMTIPWIASGAGIQPRPLTTLIHTMDTAATAAFALGLPIPSEWDGVPVYEAFGLPVEKQSDACK
ncbi:MAG TPA: alkaline phosphatase family protein [Anaerolineales bacterium]|nr:alkaline phosphatase family protein [Anaerolineales bacterium]